MSQEEAFRVLEEKSKTQFDVRVVNALKERAGNLQN
jgi:HD-GYP domain-containing protein (c-di-GMP phosphodiesterase class II)